ILFFTPFFLNAPANAQTYQTTQRPVTKAIYTNSGGYMESLPNDYAANPTKKYPLLIVWHGAGEIGSGSATDLNKLTLNGVTRLLSINKFPASFTVNGASYSFIVISPQMKRGGDVAATITAVTDYVKANY